MPKQSVIRLFLSATRPRTYPIAIMSLGVGQGLAYRALSGFDWTHWVVAFLAIYTALSLQILSNLANDYGDGVRGTDSHRHADSPERLVGSGVVAPSVFKRWLMVWLIQTALSGGLLIWLSALTTQEILLFFGIGALSILGAFGYTMGKKPYGYQALGEVSVFIFFGPIAVIGGYYLQVGRADIGDNLAIAMGVGLLSACVLYINNLRDVDSDRASGKRTLAQVLGDYRVEGYFALFSAAMACYLWYALAINGKFWLLILVLPMAAKHIWQVQKNRQNPIEIGKELGIIVKLVILINFLVIFFI